MEPPAKKAKVEEDEAAAAVDGSEENGKADETVEKEPEVAEEMEKDAISDPRPKVKDPTVFHPEDTTLNVLPADYGNMLALLTDGGLQYLMAGARASNGIKAGRHCFEVTIVECMNPALDPALSQRLGPLARNACRLGFSSAGSSLFLGEAPESVCFDMEGSFIHNKKKTSVGQTFARGDVLAVVLNLEEQGPNANTVSLFKNGVRASQPQALPEALRGQTLYPHVSFKNCMLRYNFGPTLSKSLPFTCRMVDDAALKEIAVTPRAPRKDGKSEVLFPVFLPDQGGFDWLDLFLQKNPSYTELSDRSIVRWVENSGISRARAPGAKHSLDKPDPGFGVPQLDDLSLRRVLQSVVPSHQRNFVVVEARASLVKEERKELLSQWPQASFRRVGVVLMGEPPADIKKHNQELILKDKQNASDAAFRVSKLEERKKREIEKRQKKLEVMKALAEKKRKKAEEAKLKAVEKERKKKEAEAKGETYVEEEEEEAPEKENEENEEVEDQAEKEEEEPEEDPPKVELTAEEKKLWYRKRPVPDVNEYTLNTTFAKFSVPEKEEGFEELRCEWTKSDKIKDYLKTWVQERKRTTRIEDLQPSEWFTKKWTEWQRVLQSWHTKQHTTKALEAKRKADAAARAARRAARKAAAEKKAAEEEAKKAAEAEAGEEAEKAEDKEEGKAEDKAPEKAEDVQMEEEEEEEPEEEKADFEALDLFAVEDILNVGADQPIFYHFGIEDWTLLSLRVELNLLTHALRRDVSDPDRRGIHVDHLAFYYNKYFRKILNIKLFGLEQVADLLQHVKDTVVVNKKLSVLEAQLPEELESYGVFAMLAEAARQDRNRRVELGEAGAAITLKHPQAQAQVAAMAAGQVLPGGTVRPSMHIQGRRPQGAHIVPPTGQQGLLRPQGQPWGYGAMRPMMVRQGPYAQTWH